MVKICGKFKEAGILPIHSLRLKGGSCLYGPESMNIYQAQKLTKGVIFWTLKLTKLVTKNGPLWTLKLTKLVTKNGQVLGLDIQ